jgi:hypothetical protein
VALAVIIVLILVAVLLPIGRHFLSLAQALPNCKITHFEGSNYFQPICFACQLGFSLLNGTCSSLP